ncbi:hypothetical protein HMPREF9075_00082 [Capnocytophaga sp. oral taxon 332 str. F0381]|uniref:hypothetical protein n=1 Tax=Capnocytophaga sp. oral taxon 332 TaxID=712213 RepID=UPI0002A40264|nr:hypothetical protein [Capnocytophaga sp. oral taxon 332]EKY13382.1 hypothetical protein HMPREF9075_00082 [Capnocytophaga sp. oral taxon 332 str. F0381]
MKEQVTTLEVGKCYQIHHDNDVLHLIRVNKEFIPLVPDIPVYYAVAEVWGSNTINTSVCHSIIEGNTYTEITQEQFKNVLNTMIYRISTYINEMN